MREIEKKDADSIHEEGGNYVEVCPLPFDLPLPEQYEKNKGYYKRSSEWGNFVDFDDPPTEARSGLGLVGFARKVLERDALKMLTSLKQEGLVDDADGWDAFLHCHSIGRDRRPLARRFHRACYAASYQDFSDVNISVDDLYRAWFTLHRVKGGRGGEEAYIGYTGRGNFYAPRPRRYVEGQFVYSLRPNTEDGRKTLAEFALVRTSLGNKIKYFEVPKLGQLSLAL